MQKKVTDQHHQCYQQSAPVLSAPIIEAVGKSVVVFAVVALWGTLAYQPQFLEDKHMMGAVPFSPGPQNTRKWTMHTLNIDVRPPTFIFVCIFSIFMALFYVYFQIDPSREERGRGLS